MLMKNKTEKIYEQARFTSDLARDFKEYCELQMKKQRGLINPLVAILAQELYYQKREMALLWGIIDFQTVLLFEDKIQKQLGISIEEYRKSGNMTKNKSCL